MKLSNIFGFLLFSSTIFFSSCQRQNISLLKKIDASSWDRDNILSFEFTIKDCSRPFDLLVIIRHTNDYPKSNLWLFTTIANEKDFLDKDTIECRLARLDGKWLGKKYIYWQVVKPIKSNFFFPASGNYTLKLEHGMRFKNVEGIKAVGIRLKHKKALKYGKI